jgi:hypothetical protein
MPRPLRSTAAAIVAASLAVSATAAVAGAAQTGGTDSAQRIEAAVDRTKREGAANVSMTQDINTNKESAHLRADGAFDFNGERGLLIMDFSGAAPFSAGAKIEYRFIRDLVYADVSAFGDAVNKLPSGKHWVRINPRKMAGQLGASGSGGQQKPPSALESLRGVSKDVEDLGNDDVRGTPAAHYKSTVDPKKAVDRLPKKARAKGGKTLRQQFGDRPLPLEVWIDDQGRVVRIQLELNLANLPQAKAAGETGTVRETVDYFEFGAPFYVYAPPKAETVDFADLDNV